MICSHFVFSVHTSSRNNLEEHGLEPFFGTTTYALMRQHIVKTNTVHYTELAPIFQCKSLLSQSARNNCFNQHVYVLPFLRNHSPNAEKRVKLQPKENHPPKAEKTRNLLPKENPRRRRTSQP